MFSFSTTSTNNAGPPLWLGQRGRAGRPHRLRPDAIRHRCAADRLTATTTTTTTTTATTTSTSTTTSTTTTSNNIIVILMMIY